MNSSADSQSRFPTHRSWSLPLAVLLLAAALIYLWILPLVRPRGDLLWGYYRLKDIYLGIPVAVGLLCAVIVLIAPAQYRRSLALRLTTLAVSLLVALAFIDVFYAFGVMGALKADYWLDQAHVSRRYSVADSELGFARKPGISWRGYVPDVDRLVEYRTDENGFRNPPGLQRAEIVFVGDSYTEAAQVPEDRTFVQQAAKASGLNAVNLSCGGYGPQQELIVLKRYGLPYKPRVVVWQLFEGNDIDDAENFAAWLKNPQQTGSTLEERYYQNSLLTALLVNTRKENRELPQATIRYHDGSESRVVVRYQHDPGKPARNPLGMAETAKAIEAGYRLCQSQGVELLVVMVPTMARVMLPNISFDRAENQMTESAREDQPDFSGRIQEVCAQLGCNFVDGVDALRKAAANGRKDLYIPNDEHLDFGGHDVIAQLVVDWLRSKNIAEAAP